VLEGGDVNEREDATLSVLWGWLDLVFTGALIVGMFLLAAEWRPAAVLVVGALGGLIAGHLALGAVAYRRVMRRPWPQVAPLQDDDWDD
jgi:hypothetical protein